MQNYKIKFRILSRTKGIVIFTKKFSCESISEAYNEANKYSRFGVYGNPIPIFPF